MYEAIARNIPNPTNEALWAAPGTMVGALHMFGWTGEERWRELYLENVEQLWRTWLPSESAHCHLWTQDLYGSIVQLLGAGHGFAGNAYALLRGAALLPAERREALYDRCVETLRATAVLEGDSANWPQSVGAPRPGRTHMLVQWCHGAPGIVTGLADFPDSAVGRHGRHAGQRRESRFGMPARWPRARASATARRATAMPSSSSTGAPATQSGLRARDRLRCTQLLRANGRGSSMGADATRYGLATRDSRFICGTA